MKDNEAYWEHRAAFLRSLNALAQVVPDDSEQHLYALANSVDGITDHFVEVLEDSTKIPPEKRTRPVSKLEVAKMVCPKSNAKASVRALNDAIVAGDFRCQRMNRSRHWFHLDDFAPEHQEKLRE